MLLKNSLLDTSKELLSPFEKLLFLHYKEKLFYTQEKTTTITRISLFVETESCRLLDHIAVYNKLLGKSCLE